MTIDSFDIHDGYKLVKGHAGAAVVPAVFATLPYPPGGTVTGAELLASLVVGYEIALRAGLALHATACDFHTSGAWNALGCAAVAARHLGLDRTGTRHALGTAEFYGPRSPMMRCIDFPTMVKDGTGWGALAGVSAGLLAALGFTGAPAATVESEDVAHIWSDLSEQWLILDVYFKPFAVCYWAQPAVVGAMALQKQYHIEPAQIRQVRVSTFYQATCLKCREPASTDEAQYSLPYPVAAALVYGRLGLNELTGPSLVDPLTLRLAGLIELVEDPDLSARFPAQRFARVEILTSDGNHYDSGETTALWEPTAPPTDAELLEKFRWLAATFLNPGDVSQLERLVWNCSGLADVSDLVTLLAKPIYQINSERMEENGK
jgi:2-methylcitrate dehydratase PrpD